MRGGPPSYNPTSAEELAINLNKGRPEMKGIQEWAVDTQSFKLYVAAV